MKPAAALLENFTEGFGQVNSGTAELCQKDYEAGYKAGWDDATIEQLKFQEALKADLSQTLQELAFTFHEARANVLQSIEPVFRELITKTVPSILKETVGMHIVEQLQKTTAGHLPDSLTLAVAPKDRDRIEAALPADLTAPLDIVEDTELETGQARFQFDQITAEFDLGAMETAIQSSVRGYFDHYRPQDIQNG